ncbi:MAG: phosphomannomutase [Acidimicrobiaceae bacterium]|nr:phosphomannomutase [Acidimicrobiaceae bacterium]
MEPINASELLIQVQEWIEYDPDPETRIELQNLLEQNDLDALHDRFSGRLTFGTAGIRGVQGGGPNRMNQLTLRRVAICIAKYLGKDTSVVIGYDARKNSQTYAADMANVLSHYGVHSQIFTEVVPTPLVSFAVRQQSANLGIMITASHNPATDNGCKVFLSDGAQLRSPVDTEIDERIEMSQLPPREISTGAGKVQEIETKVWDKYCSTIANTVRGVSGSLTIAYTPLHGVSWKTVERIFELVGVTDVVTVQSQLHPDPDFPSTPFPNPEETGSLDLLFEVARNSKADIAVANDPDGDRLAIGVPTTNGEWRILTGDEVGALLCNRILESTTGQNRKVVSSVVSSSLIGKIAKEAEVEHSQTLTGFKWIISEAYRDPTKKTVFSYEEALGYAVCDSVRDKDGISAALLFIEMAEDLARKNLTVLDQINNLSLKHGLHLSRSQALRISEQGSLSQIDFAARLLDRKPPESLGGLHILEFCDYDQAASTAGLLLPQSNMVRLILETGIRILIRPSGTEPVVKVYLEKIVKVEEGQDIDHERSLTNFTFDSIEEGLQKYLKEILTG